MEIKVNLNYFRHSIKNRSLALQSKTVILQNQSTCKINTLLKFALKTMSNSFKAAAAKILYTNNYVSCACHLFDVFVKSFL